MPRPAFFDQAAFAPSNGYQLLPFQFMDFDGRVLIANDVGEHEILRRGDFDLLVQHSLPPETDVYWNLKSKQFLADSDGALPLTMLTTKYRTKRSFLNDFTALHIFVVTLRCDTSCHYCQVSRVSANRSKYDMTPETADRALDLAFASPSPAIKIEFQGGEPLLNFDLIRHIVIAAERRNESVNKNLQFVLASNLSCLSEEMLTFLHDHAMLVSTSLDGPEFVHNSNRPKPAGDAYETTVRGIQRARDALGSDRIAALMTTTRLSLAYPEAIVDEYVAQGFAYIFLRPMSPYGFAVKTQRTTGYRPSDFVTFYKRALAHVIELNRARTPIVEAYAQLLLTKILTPYSVGYVDLRSPTGAGIGGVVYNYDGDVYASDEGRMLAEMGDKTFRMGNVHSDTYGELFGGSLLRTLVAASCVESLPGCADCAFQTFCGADPVENHATQGDIFGHRPTSAFCYRNMEIIRHLLRLYHGDDGFVRQLFLQWASGVSATDFPLRIPE